MPNVLPLIRTKRGKFAVKVLNSHKLSQKIYRFGDLWEAFGCKTGAVAKNVTVICIIAQKRKPETLFESFCL